MLTDFLEYAFLQRALAGGLMVAVICPAVGLFLVLRRFAQIGDTLAHVSLAGIAAGLLIGTYPTAVGLGFSVGASLGMDRLRRSYAKYSELSVAIVLSASAALAVMLMSAKQGATADILAYLFGSVMTVSGQDLLLIGVVGSLVLIFLGFLYKELLSVSFDEEQARINGLPVGLINTVLIALTAMTVTLSMRVVGVLLVSSLMVVPVAAALQLARSFRSALFASIGFGLLSVLTGIVAAHGLDLAPGGTVVMVAVLLLMGVLAFKRLRHVE